MQQTTKRLPRRGFLWLAGSAIACPAVSRKAAASIYPDRPVRIIVPFPAGLTPDIMARLMAQWLSDRLGQQFFVENHPGAAGNIGTETVVRAAADGYTLLLVAEPNTVNASLYHNLAFNFERDIAPVASLVEGPLVMDVNPAVPSKTVAEFIAYAKANPGKINMASGGSGSPQHVAGELFKMMTGVDIVHVPYQNPLPDLLAGQVQVYFGPIASSLGYIRSGKLRALAVTGTTRSQALPEVPAVAETVPGYSATSWYGIGAPSRTQSDVIEKLNHEINAGLADPALRARLTDLGVESMPISAAAFGKFIATETDKWGNVVKFASIKID